MIGRIDWGDFYQMNLCVRLHARPTAPRRLLFAQLWLTGSRRRTRPGAGLHRSSRMMASFQPGAVPAGPWSRRLTAPIKGTAPRTAAMTRHGCAARSAKDAAENIMITDLMRNDLSRVCRPGSVRVEELLSVQPHPGVWHLVSTVRGT